EKIRASVFRLWYPISDRRWMCRQSRRRRRGGNVRGCPECIGNRRNATVRLDKLLERLEYEVAQGSDQTEVTTLVNDSRKVEKGSVFVCISGAVSDGHKFAQDVVEKGAAALVVEKDVEVPEDVTVIRVPDTRYALALMSAAYF